MPESMTDERRVRLDPGWGYVIPTPQGLTRSCADPRPRVCGCGEPASTVLMAMRRMIPLCPAHTAAHDQQVQRRAEAIFQAWNGARAQEEARDA